MTGLTAERVAFSLGGMAASLVGISILTRWLVFQTGHDNMLGVVHLFDLDQESNLPTWFSSIEHFVAALILAVIGFAEREHSRSSGRAWFGLAFLFLMMSVDEVASLHESSIVPMRRLLGLGGIFHFAWVVPGGALVLAVAAAYASWFFRLPGRTRHLALAAGALFLTGAIGFELIGGLLASRSLHRTALYFITSITEEALEMAGVVVWIYALLDYIRLQGYEMRVGLTNSPVLLEQNAFREPESCPGVPDSPIASHQNLV